MITQITKRDGEIVNYNVDKIILAISKANAEIEDETIPKKLLETIINLVENKVLEYEEVVSVEDVQDSVEESLLEVGLVKTARAYIQYREQQKQKRKLDIFSKRTEMKPYEYPELMEYADAIRNALWVVTEYNFTGDIQDFKTEAKPHEQAAVTNCMLAIAQIEVDVKTFWGKIYDRMPKYEIGAVGAVFAESETRHAEAYSHLLEILGFNERFNDLKDIPVIQDRIDYLKRSASWANTGDEKDYVLSLILFSLFIEHTSLFSQFLIMMSFKKHKNMFSGLSNVIEATSLEEQLHGMFGIDIVNIVREERPEMFDERMEKIVIEMSKEAYEAEKKIVDWIFEEGELDFLPKKVVLEFIKNRLNNSLESVGYKKLFETDEELLENSRWFDDELLSSSLSDFLYKRSRNYDKFSMAIKHDTLFSDQSDVVKDKITDKNKVNEILRLRMLPQ